MSRALGSSAPLRNRRIDWAPLVGVLVLIGAGYGIYILCKPLTPVEVSERFITARTAADAKKYAVPALYPIIDDGFAQPDSGSSTSDEITGDGPAPPGMVGHFVGVVSHQFMPEFGRRVRMELVLHLIEESSWKVYEAYLLTADGQVIDPPIAIGEIYREMHNLPPAVGRKVQVDPGPAGKSSPSNASAKKWYEDRRNLGPATRGVFSFFKAGGFKMVGAVAIGLVVLLLALRRRIATWFWHTANDSPPPR